MWWLRSWVFPALFTYDATPYCGSVHTSTGAESQPCWQKWSIWVQFIIQLIFPWAKWLPFPLQYFQMHYCENQCWPDSLMHICGTRVRWVNSLAPGKFEWNFRYVIFQGILLTDGWGISCEIALIRLSVDFTDDQSTLVQVMAWCRQATSHYLSQCWPRSLMPYGVTRPQWVKDKHGNVLIPQPVATKLNAADPAHIGE